MVGFTPISLVTFSLARDAFGAVCIPVGMRARVVNSDLTVPAALT